MTHPIDLQETEDCSHYEKLLCYKEYPPFPAKIFRADTFNINEYLETNTFDQPFLVEGNSNNFGLRIPSSDLTMSDIARQVGKDRDVRLMDVGLQTDIHGYNIAQYAEYLERQKEESNRGRVLNMITLEISDTELSNLISPPTFVNEIDWIRSVWPLDRISNNDYPKVQKYCLAGMKGSYTDFHIDFGGTSVWYHIVRGAKRFYLIPPSIANLQAFRDWNNSSEQDQAFFGDCVENCFSLDLKPGQTLIIPSCWIHSVYTPLDSIVFGGNFLNAHSILRQLQAHQIERSLKIDKECMFPEFKQIHAYFLCELLPLMQNMAQLSSITATSLSITADDSITEVMCKRMMSKHVLVQIPFLLCACDDWISTDLALKVEYDKTSKSSLDMDSFDEVINEWWKAIGKLAELLKVPFPTDLSNRSVSKLSWKKGKLLLDEKSTGNLSTWNVVCLPTKESFLHSKRQRKQYHNSTYITDNTEVLSDYDCESEHNSTDDNISLPEDKNSDFPEVKHDQKTKVTNQARSKMSVRDKIRSILGKR